MLGRVGTDIQKLHQVGKENGAYAANRLLALLSILFNKAIEFGLWVKTNPMMGIKKFREQSRDRFLQSDELPRFFQALAEEPNEDIRDYILISLLTGARKSNVLAMKWEQINLSRKEWRIPETKNGTPQPITLPNEALALLKKRQNTFPIHHYVFPGNVKNGHLMDQKRNIH